MILSNPRQVKGAAKVDSFLGSIKSCDGTICGVHGPNDIEVRWYSEFLFGIG